MSNNFKGLVENSATEKGAGGGGSASSPIANRWVSPVVVDSIYPKLVDREGASGDSLLAGGSRIRNGTERPTGYERYDEQGPGAKDDTTEAKDPIATPKGDVDVEGSLAMAAQRSLSIDGGGGGNANSGVPGLKDGT